MTTRRTLSIFILCCLLAPPAYAAHKAAITVPAFISSVDTMKESMDSDCPNCQLTDAQIANDVYLSASLNNNYITVDTRMDYPAYMARWVKAVRAAGRHVWFRSHWNAWEGNNGVAGTMTPVAYEQALFAFIIANPTLFAPGDILDPCPEPENGKYWAATYGPNWSWQPQAPNAATDEFNAFIQASSLIAQAALIQAGVHGVTTTIRSTNSWFASHPQDLYPDTVQQMGRITVDSYPEQSTTDPATAAISRTAELQTIESIRGLPIVIGEMGYSVNQQVPDATQAAVLHAELAAIAGLPYIVGLNYWTGAGGPGYGGYTNLFAGTHGAWVWRPAAAEVASYFAQHLAG